MNSGATAPSTTVANMFWYDTANDQIKIRNEANSGWITIGTVNQSTNNFESATVNGKTVGTLTAAGGVAYATSTTALAATAAGTSGQVLTSNGASAPTWATLPFTKSYESSQQTLTAAGALTLAHGLGVAPTLIRPFLVCIASNLGYAVNDIVPINDNTNAVANASYGQAITSDSTNVYIRYGVGGVYELINKTSGAASVITIGSWRLIVRAWA